MGSKSANSFQQSTEVPNSGLPLYMRNFKPDIKITYLATGQ